MASRTMTVGDTNPDAMLTVSDATGPLDLTSADEIEVLFIGVHFEFSGPGTPIWPAEDDPGGSGQKWNLSYAFAADDTSEVDSYKIRVRVTWVSGDPDQITTFKTDDTLSVEALPVTT